MLTRERFYLTVIAILSVLLFFYWQCKPGCKCPEVKERIVEKVIRDTFKTKPVPVYTKKPKKNDIIIDTKLDTLYIPQEGEPIDTARIIRQALEKIPDYATLKLYVDTAHVKNEYMTGTIVTMDSVQFNTLFSHQVFTDFNLRMKERVIQEKKRQFLIGISGGISNKDNPLSAFGAGAQYIDKTGKAYGIDYIMMSGSQKMYYFSFKKKL